MWCVLSSLVTSSPIPSLSTSLSVSAEIVQSRGTADEVWAYNHNTL